MDGSSLAHVNGLPNRIILAVPLKGKFAPTYGVRAASDGTTVEMVIDFASGEIRLFSGRQRAVLRTSDSPKTFFEKLFKI